MVPWPPNILPRFRMRPPGGGHQAQHDVLVGGMILRAGRIAAKHDPASVGRGVREDVAVFVCGDLFLVGPVGVHPPDLHVAGAIGVEVNVFPVAGIIGAVVLARIGGQARLRAACDGNGVNVEIV